MIRCSLPLLTETRVVPTGSGRLPLISPRPKLGMSRGQPHTTGSATSFSGRTLKRRNVLWRALFANLRFLAKLRFLCYKKKRQKYSRSPQRSLHSRFEYSAATYFFPDCKAHSTAPPSKKSLENYVRIVLLSYTIPPFGRQAISIASTL